MAVAAPADYDWVLSTDLPEGYTVHDIATAVGSNAINPFDQAKHSDRFSVSCFESTTDRRLVALALVLMPSSTTKHARDAVDAISMFTCTLQVLWVREDHRNQGLGQRLYDQVHYNAFVVSQIKADAKCLEAAMLTFDVPAGSCAKQPAALLLYHKNGWECRDDKGQRWTTDMVKHRPTARPRAPTPLRHPLLPFLENQWLRAQLNEHQTEPPTGDTRRKRPLDDSASVTLIAPPPCDLRAAYLAPRALHVVTNLFEHVRGNLPPWSDADGRAAKVYQVNAAASTGTLRLLGHPVDKDHGTIRFNILVLPAAAIDRFLCAPCNHSTVEHSEGVWKHHLLIPPMVPGRRVVQLDGYPLPYALVNKPVDQKKQVERTAVCSKANGFDCLHAIPGWTILVAHLKRKFDLPNFEKMLYTVHFLLNDTTCQTSYDWHSDGPDLALSWPDEKRLVGLAVQLGANAPTAMQVWGCQPTVYGGRGACVLFSGASLHRSVPWSDAVPRGTSVYKVVLFLLEDK